MEVDNFGPHKFGITVNDYDYPEREILHQKCAAYTWGEPRSKYIKPSGEMRFKDTAQLEFKFKIMPGSVIWMTQMFDLGIKPTYEKAKYRRMSKVYKTELFNAMLDDNWGQMHIQYVYTYYYNKKIKKYSIKLQIDYIRIEICNFEDIIQKYNHKIVCAFYDDDMREDNKHIGRPQHISTNYKTRIRIYKWNSIKSPRGLREFRKRDSSDFDEQIRDSRIVRDVRNGVSLNINSLASYRITSVSEEEDMYVMDNDEFMNSCIGLPITLKFFKTVIFNFYNFKDTPPTYVSVKMDKDEFRDMGALTKVVPGTDGKATVTFYFNNIIEIHAIILTVKDFEDTLNFPNKVMKTQTH